MGLEFNALGEYVGKVREIYGVPVRELCADMRMSSATYSRLIKGEEMMVGHYFRTFGYIVDTYAEDELARSKFYTDFFRIGNQGWKNRQKGEEQWSL